MSVREHQVGPVTIYYSTRRFPHARIAKETWEQVNRRLAGKNLDLGFYRHGPSTHPGCLVTAISLHKGGVEAADFIMRRGVEVDVLDDGDMSVAELEAMIARRARVVMENRDRAGHMVVRREGDGVKLNRDGSYDE